ncbi:DUF6420 family protein [Streptomyces sp. NPDC001073]
MTAYVLAVATGELSQVSSALQSRLAKEDNPVVQVSLIPAVAKLAREHQDEHAHIRITLDHMGCPAQLTDEKNAAFKRLALATEGHCVQAGCRHHAAYADGVLRIFEVRNGSIALAAFVRAALAVELGTSPSRTGSCRRPKRWLGLSARRVMRARPLAARRRVSAACSTCSCRRSGSSPGGRKFHSPST